MSRVCYECGENMDHEQIPDIIRDGGDNVTVEYPLCGAENNLTQEEAEDLGWL